MYGIHIPLVNLLMATFLCGSLLRSWLFLVLWSLWHISTWVLMYPWRLLWVPFNKLSATYIWLGCLICATVKVLEVLVWPPWAVLSGWLIFIPLFGIFLGVHLMESLWIVATFILGCRCFGEKIILIVGRFPTELWLMFHRLHYWFFICPVPPGHCLGVPLHGSSSTELVCLVDCDQWPKSGRSDLRGKESFWYFPWLSLW